MSKLNVLIIDHETDRGNKLKENILSLGYSAVHYRFVWGGEVRANPICDSETYVAVADVNFVHSNNVCSQEFIDFILQKHPNSWVVEYSGGGIEAMGNRSPRSPKHLLYPKSVGIDAQIENLAEFLGAVGEKKQNAGEILMGFNPPLEAKLELLHMCLTPEGAKKILNGEFPKELESEREKFWNRQTSYQNWTVEQIVKALAGQPQENKSISFKHCFDASYRVAVEALRDALLPEHEYA